MGIFKSSLGSFHGFENFVSLPIIAVLVSPGPM